MARFGRRVALTLVFAGWVATPRLVQAQAPAPEMAAGTRGGLGSAPYAGMYANPYANPYTNPFLNPYMTQQPLQGNAAVYLFAAQQQTGGIGSGRLSGTRPEPRPARPVPRQAGEAETRITDRPGAGAAGYFNRGHQPESGANRFFNRAARYNRSNGR